jgi:hypothetical protein
VTLQPASRGWEPVAWLRLSRECDRGWLGWAVPNLLIAGGHLVRKGRTQAIAEVDFGEWPELGQLVAPMRRGLEAMEPFDVRVLPTRARSVARRRKPS